VSSPALRRVAAIAAKELRHIARDPATLFFVVLWPVFELLILGYAIDTNVRHVRTVVLDQARTQESRALVQSFVSCDDFAVVGDVAREEDLTHALVSGKAQVGLKIPEDYSRRLQAGETAQVQVLVDGTVSSVTAEVVNVSNAIALRESLQRALGDKALPVESRPRVLFNPDARSANFFTPGLWVVLSQLVATMLTASSIVREKLNGTLEQLFMTPVRAGELLVGKLLPYLVLTFLELCLIALLMRVAFGVPIHGSFLTLLTLALPFVLTMLGVGLWISTRASTHEAAMHLVTATVMPSVFLSGYVFPLESMLPAFRYVARAIPTTWLVDAARGVILRGAGWPELWPHAVVLWGMALGVLTGSVLRFRKRLA
jgi:ABC-2 type transport system permease protein